MAGLSFLRVVDNTTLLKREQEALANKALAERQAQPMILGLAAHLRECWDAA